MFLPSLNKVTWLLTWLVRIYLLISAINSDFFYFFFLSGKLFYKSNRKILTEYA